MPPLNFESIAWLSVSSWIGILVGDTALFVCMNRLGPRRSGVLFATHALFSALLAWLFLGLSKLKSPLNWKSLLNTALSATVSMVIGMTLILQALKTGQANLVAIFSSIAPVLLLPLLWIVYRRKPASGAWWGGAMTVIGSAMIVSAKI